MSIIYENNKDYSTSSRYNIIRTCFDTDTNERYLETYNQVSIPDSSDDQYHIVDTSETNRLDMISLRYYNTPGYWWAIALANQLIDPFIVEAGVILRIPSLLTLSDIDLGILTRRGGPSIG